jgi:hypothetical protein
MRKVTASQKQALMTKMLGTAKGRQHLAASMQGPLRKLRDYQSIGRKAFFVDELPDGTLPIYDMDPALPAYVVGEEGDNVLTVAHSTRLLIPLFELASNPKIPFTQVKERRFDIVSRVKKKAQDELFRKEDSLIMAVLEQAGANNTSSPAITANASTTTMATMVSAFAGVEQWGLRVDKVFCNPYDFKIFRNAGKDYLDFETQRELLRTGLMGSLYGAQVFTSMQITKGHMYFLAEPEFLGVMPVRIDLTILPADEPVNRSFGWSIFLNEGIGVHNPYGIQQVTINEGA